MTPAEIARLLEGADLADQSGRQTLRERFLRLRLGGRIGSGVYADVMRALDGAAKDVEKTTTTKASTVVVEVAKYGSNGHNGATE